MCDSRCSRRTTGAFALSVLALVCLGQVAQAQQSRPNAEAIVLLLVEAPREGLTDALRIHAPAGTRVVVAPPPRASSTAGRVREAQGALSTHERGVMAMWLDEEHAGSDGREVVVYIVARRNGRALIEVVRVRTAAVEELNRAIAIKAREVLDALTRAEGDLAPAIARPARRPDDVQLQATPSHPSLDFAMLVEIDGIGATAAGSADPQLGGQVAAGLAVAGNGWLAGVVGTARIVTALSGETRSGSVESDEVAVGIGLRALKTTTSRPKGERPWQTSVGVGGFVHFGARLLSAEGTTALGSFGTADRAVPFVSLGPEMRLLLVQSLWLRTTVGAELALQRQRFALNGEDVLDLGLARGVAEVGILTTLF